MIRSNLTTTKTVRFSEKSFFYTKLGFLQSHSRSPGDIEGFVQVIPGKYRSKKPINVTGVDKIHLKCNYINGSIVYGVREPILYSFALTSPPGNKINKEPRFKLFKEINKSVLSLITFYIEDGDHKPVHFNREKTCFFANQVKYKN